mgnify:CR=1 FL=1
MPIAEIAGELISPILRILGYILIDLIIEVLVRGVGRIICRPFSRSLDADGGLVMLAGVMFWIAVFVLGTTAYSYVETYMAVDACLDSGGQFNRHNEAWEHD